MHDEKLNGRGRRRLGAGMAAAALMASALALPGCDADQQVDDPALIEEGKQVFRFETFGDERLWTDTLRLHEVIETAVDPTTALSIGLKVDSEKLPPGILQTVDLKSPATTVALLKLDAVVGLKGTVVTEGGRDRLTRLGTTCALCHSTVDNSVMPGIGVRIDGAANRDLNPGAIIGLSPSLTPEQKAVYNSWGPGRYDPRFNIDGQNGPVLIPPAYGLRGVPHTTYTGDGDISYWNNYVAVTQMGGQGNFRDDRIGVNRTLPAGTPDLVTPRLDALRAYQFSLNAPAPPAGAVDLTASDRGRAVFEQRCARCHSGSDRSEEQLHGPSETGVSATYANRSASKRYRTTPLRGLLQHPPYFHDGSAPTLEAVVAHYERVLSLSLTPGQRSDLVEYLKSL
jgi:mono/diheme cytochrome c family protein